jgi:hypothetical protein
MVSERHHIVKKRELCAFDVVSNSTLLPIVSQMIVTCLLEDLSTCQGRLEDHVTVHLISILEMVRARGVAAMGEAVRLAPSICAETECRGFQTEHECSDPGPWAIQRDFWAHATAIGKHLASPNPSDSKNRGWI